MRMPATTPRSRRVFVLDTDTYSQYVRGQEHIRRHMAEEPSASIYLSAITAEELFKGRLKSIQQARERDSPLISHAFDGLIELSRQTESFRQAGRMLRYDEEAERLFQSWPNALKRAGSQDCRIAAVALVHGFTVVTAISAPFPAFPWPIGALRLSEPTSEERRKRQCPCTVTCPRPTLRRGSSPQ